MKNKNILYHEKIKLYFHKIKKHKYYGMKVRFVNIIKQLRIKFKSGCYEDILLNRPIV